MIVQTTVWLTWVVGERYVDSSCPYARWDAELKVIVDAARCTGHGRCHATASEIYRLDDDGYCALREFDVPDGLDEAAVAGADNCPERAITVVRAVGS